MDQPINEPIHPSIQDARMLVLEAHRSELRVARAMAEARLARRGDLWAMLGADPTVGPDTPWVSSS